MCTVAPTVDKYNYLNPRHCHCVSTSAVTAIEKSDMCNNCMLRSFDQPDQWQELWLKTCFWNQSHLDLWPPKFNQFHELWWTLVKFYQEFLSYHVHANGWGECTYGLKDRRSIYIHLCIHLFQTALLLTLSRDSLPVCSNYKPQLQGVKQTVSHLETRILLF